MRFVPTQSSQQSPRPSVGFPVADYNGRSRISLLVRPFHCTDPSPFSKRTQTWQSKRPKRSERLIRRPHSRAVCSTWRWEQKGERSPPREDEFMASAAFLSRFIPALTSAFGFDEYYGAACNIDEYDNVESTVEFLFRNGVRA